MADSNPAASSSSASSKISKDSLMRIEYKPMNYLEKVKRWSTDSSDRDFTPPSRQSTSTLDDAIQAEHSAPPIVGGIPKSTPSLPRPLSQELYTTGFNVDTELDHDETG